MTALLPNEDAFLALPSGGLAYAGHRGRGPLFRDRLARPEPAPEPMTLDAALDLARDPASATAEARAEAWALLKAELHRHWDEEHMLPHELQAVHRAVHNLSTVERVVGI